MEFKYFSSTKVSVPVLRRRVSDEMLMLLSSTADVISSRGKSLLCCSCYPNMRAYKMAVSRLRTAGLLVERGQRGETPTLQLTDDGEERLPEVCRAKPPWQKKWNGSWYILTYDVPETDRRYREMLRRFLMRMRMGCLQKSVWVTAKDIRPAYDDLREAAAIESFAFLFESRMVLGRDDQEVVRSAWDVKGLQDTQSWYIDTCSKHLSAIERRLPGKETLANLLREEGVAYLAAMEADPLLPVPLWPRGYRGKEAWKAHREFTRRVSTLL